MKKLILMLLGSIGLALICGCDGSVNQVKNGTLGGHPDVTVGAAFDGSFDSTKWSTITDKGRKIVHFTGRIKQETHDAAAKSAYFDASIIVTKYKSEEFNKRIALYDEKQKSIDANIDTGSQSFCQGRNLESQKILKDLVEDFKKESYWPVGQDVEFSFIVYPDGKQFEIDSFSNESWAKLNLNLDSVLNVIFAK